MTKTATKKKTRRPQAKGKRPSLQPPRAPGPLGLFKAKDGTLTVYAKDPIEHEAYLRRTRLQADPPTADEKLEQIADGIRSCARLQERLIPLELGRLYFEAKRLLRSKFTKWADDLGRHKKSARQNYIKIYKLCHGRPELVDGIDTSKLQLICETRFPDDWREEIFDAGKCEGTVRELAEAASEYRAAKGAGDEAAMAKAKKKLSRHVGDLEHERAEKLFLETRQRVVDDLERHIGTVRSLLRHLADAPQDEGLVTQVKGLEEVLDNLASRLTLAES